MLYFTCTMIFSVDLAHYGISRAKNWASVDCGTSSFWINAMTEKNQNTNSSVQSDKSFILH